MKRNSNFDKVESRYLFQEIRARSTQFSKEHPEAKLLRLGIGDTTEPIGQYIATKLALASAELGMAAQYTGYGPEQGIPELREKISQVVYQGIIPADDIFVSDGAKCDIGRLQLLFGQECKIALQDPTYPVYLDSSLIYRGGKVTFLPCTPENNFVPDLSQAKGSDVLFLCLPNNPTGTIFSHSELEKIVQFARQEKMFIVFDTAYSFYVQDGYPKSIYEIEGAKEVAIELGSFSKIAGFSGVRLGWAVVPDPLKFADGASVKQDWMRINTTFFNGASIIAQKGGLAALEPEGQKEVQAQVAFYLENTRLLKETLDELGIESYGGTHSPYLWVRLEGLDSWQAFDYLLYNLHIVTTPGSGFGPSGDGFLRISGFGKRTTIEEACKRFKKQLAAVKQ